MTRYRLLAGAAVFVLVTALSSTAEAKPLFQRGGSPVVASGDEVPLSSLITTTTAASSALANCTNPSYPDKWEWDPTKILGDQPQAATEAMGLTPKIEQYRGGVLIATWDKFNSNTCQIPNRAEDPDSTASHACGGPFIGGIQAFATQSYVAWKEGDVFKVYPAVYKEALSISPVEVLRALSTAVTAGQTQITLADTSMLKPGYALYDSATYLTPITRILSVDSPTQITLDKPILATGTFNMIFLKNVDLDIQGVTQNVAGVPTRPVILYDDTWNSANANGMIYTFAQTNGDIKHLKVSNIDLAFKELPYGVHSYYNPNAPWSIIALAGPEIQGDLTFEDMRIHGAKYKSWPNGASGVLSGNPNTVRRPSGTLTFNRIKFFDNGGASGPQHHVYIGEGDWTVVLTNSYLTSSYFGHLFKTRAIHNVIKGNYFEGGALLPPFENFGESNDLDMPCGGEATVTGNIFTKKFEYLANNGHMIDYMEDGQCANTSIGPYDWSEMTNKPVKITNNTFVAFGSRLSGGSGGSPNDPLLVLGTYPDGRHAVTPSDGALFATDDFTYKNNVFVGFCPYNTMSNFGWYANSTPPVGPNLTAGFSDINKDYSLKTNYVPSGDTSILGETSYSHYALAGTRTKNTFGAQDASTTATPSGPLLPSVFFVSRTGYKLPSGSSANLYAIVTGATSCTASGDWSGSKSTTLINEFVTLPIGVPATYTLSCTGPGGTASSDVTIEAVDLPVVTSYSVTPSTTSGPGQPATLAWTTNYADSCLQEDATLLRQRANYTYTINPTQTITYSIRCTGPGGTDTLRSVKVTVTGTTELPTVHMRADDLSLSIAAGETATLTWGANAADTCTGSGGDFDTGGATAGLAVIEPLASPGSVTYHISCTGPGGTSADRTVTIATVL